MKKRKMNKKILFSSLALLTITGAVAAVATSCHQPSKNPSNNKDESTPKNPSNNKDESTKTFTIDKTNLDTYFEYELINNVYYVKKIKKDLPQDNEIVWALEESPSFKRYLDKKDAKLRQLANLTLSNVLKVADNAFENSTWLKNIKLNKATTIGNAAFWKTAQLNSVTATAVSEVEGFAFSETGLVNLVLPNALEIKGYAFYKANSLESLTASKVNKLGDQAFGHAAKLTNLETNNLESIGLNVFENTPLFETLKNKATNGLVVYKNALLSAYEAKGEVF
ncbi:leucine-rich repeat domain-containing protein [Ureaplasma zalophigenitalium]|uniref:Leucine-rich repeat domain-containing protein n=1 Tax=Ureaplasma zalophigenitalium TaxID=907723 RepID=A0ABT3BP18_9BACT|nr:leucine-rich repeat domain-containing protein [Ureaplasma zalophigenitalium]MCV3753928.1 leucine-rich repeat domain-containing protein [Ureaplasma zalophigenitalium]